MSQGQAAIPSQPRAKALRACLLCSIIQTPADFRRIGCPNCEELMQVRGAWLSSAYGALTEIPLDERICRQNTVVYHNAL